MRKDKTKPSYLTFNRADYGWSKDMDYRNFPDAYKVGKGEQGVLICEPYKSEILPHWRFKDPATAAQSAKTIYGMFHEYLAGEDFVGADMARKYLQMGFTRSRRYANYKGGNKYDKQHSYALNEKGTGDVSKSASASIFFTYWKLAESEIIYQTVKAGWKILFG